MTRDVLLIVLVPAAAAVFLLLLWWAFAAGYRRNERLRDRVHTALRVPDGQVVRIDRLGFSLAAILALAYIVTLAVLSEARFPHHDFYVPLLRWLDGFVRSPGLGGLAAVGAAFVAFGQWRRQREAERKARRDQQWWDAFKLIYTQVMAGSVRSHPLTLTLLDTLAKESDTEVQKAAADALIEELLLRDRDGTT